MSVDGIDEGGRVRWEGEVDGWVWVWCFGGGREVSIVRLEG